MRGPPSIRSARYSSSGITPAYAGTTSISPPRPIKTADHPRLCGDHPLERLVSGPIRGSPPLMRGPHTAITCDDVTYRITPAYAGTTPRKQPTGPYRRDHPRLCGDHDYTVTICDRVSGSPPLMRGPLRIWDSLTPGLRITPAYAGTTSTSPSATLFPSDHPRLCGDHELWQMMDDLDLGSPPLMRGPHTHAQTCFMSVDHPRLCGDHS